MIIFRNLITLVNYTCFFTKTVRGSLPGETMPKNDTINATAAFSVTRTISINTILHQRHIWGLVFASVGRGQQTLAYSVATFATAMRPRSPTPGLHRSLLLLNLALKYSD